MVFARAEPEKDLMSIRDNVEWLEKTQIGARSRQPQPPRPYSGAWTYPVTARLPMDGDNSNSQFALLALHEAERVGVPANNETWQRAKSIGKMPERRRIVGLQPAAIATARAA